MLKEILSRGTCAECRICCGFDTTDLWETPVFFPELKEKIKAENPEIKFMPYKNAYLMKMFEPDSEGLMLCPMLTETGCALGDEKPFDCRIWPFRVMKLDSRLVITLSPICPSVQELSVKRVSEFLKESKLSDLIFKTAESNPAIIKDYIPDYPIFAVR